MDQNSGDKRIVLTGFMGVGKSTVARHLSYILKLETVDLDYLIEAREDESIAGIIENRGLPYFRRIETENLKRVLETGQARIISLGGGAWTVAENRELIKKSGCTTIWLEATFEHCWRNLSASWRERPLAKNKTAAKRLFEERQRIYCLADWHFVVRPDLTSYDVARQIAEEVF